MTVILSKGFNPGMLRNCYRTANFGDFLSPFSLLTSGALLAWHALRTCNALLACDTLLTWGAFLTCNALLI